MTGFIPNLSPKGKGNDVLYQLRCKAQIEGWFEGFENVFDKYVGCCNYACSILFLQPMQYKLSCTASTSGL